MMTVYFLFFLSLFSITLGIYVLKKGYLYSLNRLFFVLSLFSSIWILVNALTGIFDSKFLIKSAYSFGALVGASGFLWMLYLIKLKSYKIIFYITLVLEIVFFILPYINGLILKDIEKVELGRFIGSIGPLFFLYAFYQICILVSFIIVSYLAFYKAKGIRKDLFRYIFIGIFLTSFITLVVSFILSLFGIIKFTFLDSLSFIIFLFFIAYLITRYRLMDIRFVISRSILYFTLIISVALSFTFITFLTGRLFQGQGEVLVTLAVSLIIVIGLDPLKRFLANLTDTFFFKGKIEYQDVLRDIGQSLARELDLELSMEILKKELEEKIKLSNIDILVLDEDSKKFRTVEGQRHIVLEPEDIIIQSLNEYREIIITEELSRKKNDKKYKDRIAQIEKLEIRLDSLKASVLVPICSEKKLICIFLIKGKRSQSAFTQPDLDFFEVLAPQVATALEKSKLFEEVQAAKANLEVLVEQRTKDLRERNRYLVALQTIIKLITRSLDFQKVMQTIADGIKKELGMIGGLLNFLDEDRKFISIGAITNSKEINDILALVPEDPRNYSVPITEPENLAVEAIKAKKIISGQRFYDFIKPALPEKIVDRIQEGLGIKSVVAVPVYSETEVIGVIDFVLNKEAEKITEVEKEMMKSLADQVGIVYRNLTLYDKIQKANDELKDANVRLKKLDKTKSEFLSIASHQLRTPLTGIKGYLSMIMQGDFGQVPPKIKNVVEDVYNNSDRLTRLVNVFLNASRIESGRLDIGKKPVDITELIAEVIKELQLTADKKKLDLIYHKPKMAAPNVMLDKDKIKDVVVNLVDNAVKYTPKGKIEILVEFEGKSVKVTVKDTGIGIKKGEDKELFKKFVRGEGIAKINTGGSGLGLFIAKKIVEAHNGKIWAESAGKDMGSAFIFTLPLNE